MNKSNFIRNQIWTMPIRWQVFRGDSTDPKDLVFSMKKSSIFQLGTKLDVFLASNTEETTCDLRVSWSWFQRLWTIKLGDTNTIIAQVHKKWTAASIFLERDSFDVTVYPFVDYAFVVTLVAILQQILADWNGEDWQHHLDFYRIWQSNIAYNVCLCHFNQLTFVMSIWDCLGQLTSTFKLEISDSLSKRKTTHGLN